MNQGIGLPAGWRVRGLVRPRVVWVRGMCGSAGWRVRGLVRPRVVWVRGLCRHTNLTRFDPQNKKSFLAEPLWISSQAGTVVAPFYFSLIK